MASIDRRLDPRAWLIWGAAASLPALLGRNPFPLALVLIVATVVRLAWMGPAPSVVNWAVVARLIGLFTAIGVLFNVLTVRSGDRVIARIPNAVPLVGGAITLNALIYGLLSALAAITLVLVGATMAAGIDWTALVRMLPPGLTTLAVAGSVAFTFLPQTARAFVEIREAQAARGHRVRGVRDLLPLVTPLLNGGLERALTLAESLEARGFGAPRNAHRQPSGLARTAAALGLAAGVAAGYLFAVGRLWSAALAVLMASLCLTFVVRIARPSIVARTRYRETRWRRPDVAVAAASTIAALAVLASANLDSASLRYEPYPTLTAPSIGLPLLLALCLLLAPAAVATKSGPA